MRYVTAIAVSAGGDRPSHITYLRWEESWSSGDWTRQQAVDWVDRGGFATVSDSSGPKLVAIHPTSSPDCVRSSPNDTPSDNLMSLPRSRT